MYGKLLEILFRVTGGFCIDGKGSLILRESYFVRIFSQYVRGFIEAGRNFILDILHIKRLPKIV